MYRIRRFGVVRTATVVAVAYAITFAIVFVPLALIGLASTSARTGGGGLAAGVLVLGLVLLVVYPVLIWVATALACLVYNLAARWVGGIEVEVVRPPQPPWSQSPPWGVPPAGWGSGAPPRGGGLPPGAPQQPWPPASPREGT